MNKITYPLTWKMQGAQVKDLHNALQVLLDRALILAHDEGGRRELTDRLRNERAEQLYYEATAQLVNIFQDERKLQVSGEVDKPTAEVLNMLLRELNLLDTERPRLVAGNIRREDGTPLQGVRVRAAHVTDDGREIRLGDDSPDAEGRYTIRYDMLPDVDAVNLKVSVLDEASRSIGSSQVVQNAKPLELLDLIIPSAGDKSYRIEGKVTSRVSASMSRLRVVIVDKGIGSDVQLAETATDESGTYQVSFSDSAVRRRGKKQPDLQVRVLAKEVFLGASEVRYNTSPYEVVNVLLDDQASATLRSEHQELTENLARHFKDRLGKVQETDKQQDITYLANKSGWDARAVALAALADQFSEKTAEAVPQELFYALFRAGLPANEEALFHTDAKTLEGVWKQAAAQGVISSVSDEKISNAISRFKTLSTQKLLTSPAMIGTSSFKEMLTVSKLNDTQQEKFAQLYTANRADLPAFWKAVSDDPVFGDKQEHRELVVKRLQVDSKLGSLTINNAELMQKVHVAIGDSGLSDLLQLAQKGYYRDEKWKELLTDVPVPKEIPGENIANYAAYMAAQVRLSYPTASLAQMVKTKELPLTGAADVVADHVHTFLTEHQEFEIGAEPVEQYISRKKLQLSEEAHQAVKQVKRLQRVHQITPSDQAMIGLMKQPENTVDAACHIVRYDKDTFVKTFAADLGGADQAALTYDRSAQIHNTVLNVVLSYLHARTAPTIGAHSSEKIMDPVPAAADDVIAYPALEQLFGSMDFCACDHCRSILSPAAYLVDLLQFLGSDEHVWNDFAALWKSEHNGVPYPFSTQEELKAYQDEWKRKNPDKKPPNTEISPFNVLMSRRPDIQHLPLTCENTNIALPYIDVVNETLEYYVANQLTLEKKDQNGTTQNLGEYHGHDTKDVTTEDLLANPQFVNDTAYQTLRNEYFPAPLPFNQPLEYLRRYFNKFEVPLPLAMERLRKNDDLERDVTNPYGWRDILMEEIGISRSEHEILTDSPNTVPLWQIYGFPKGTADTQVVANLSNVKKFSRWVGITYEELIAILKTHFINPNSDLIPKLERLGVSFTTLNSLKEGTITDAEFDKMLPADLSAPNPAEYGSDIKAWIKNNDNYARIMGLITVAIPGSTCESFSNAVFRYSDPAKQAQNIGTVEFIRLLRFIRLWKKLGWTIEQTDAAICVLYREDLMPLGANDLDEIAKLNTGFLTLLPRVGIINRVMKALNLTVKRDLYTLLACWSDISTYGNNALYRQMFLEPTFLKQHPVFADNGYGEFLQYVEVAYTHSTPSLEQLITAASGRISYKNSTNHLSYSGILDAATRDALKAVAGVTRQFQDAIDSLYTAQRLFTHTEALRSAFNLSGDEYNQIAVALGYDENTALTIPNISAIFRRGWLARNLKISVHELLLLSKFTGLDPFTAPDMKNPAILRLIELVQKMKDRSLKLAVALYLIWNQDVSGKSAPEQTQITELARTLRSDYAAINDQFSAIDDPNGDVARARMTLVYGQETSDAFFALLDDTLVVDVAYTHSLSLLELAVTDADSKISYDNFRHKLSHLGLITTEIRTILKNINEVSADFQKAVDALFNRSEEIKGLFFTAHPELLDPYKTAVAQPAANRHSEFLAKFDPTLVRQRKRQQAVQRISAAAGVDLVLVQTLLDPATTPYSLHAAGDTNRPALDDALLLETAGLSAQFFFRDTATGAVDQTVSAATINYFRGNSNPLPNPDNLISGIWSGQIEAPETGFYNLIFEIDSEAAVTFTLNGHHLELVQNGNIRRNNTSLELKAGTLYEIKLTVERLKEVLSLKWETPKRSREIIPPRYLYPPTILKAFTNTYIRFLKAASLATGLGLTPNELAWFATHLDYRIKGDCWLNILPVNSKPHLNTAKKLLAPLDALLDFARIKADLSPNDESLLTVLKTPAVATKNQDSLLFKITCWDRTSLNNMLSHFGSNIAGLGNFSLFRRVYDAFALVRNMGISVKVIIQATTNEPTGDTVRDLQSALRARYDAASWRDVARSINDEMRSLQRDSLVAYILHQMKSHPESAHINTPDKLFEYFLMDVQMEPAMQTSRIRHALSSVQLFIERCLMNLEPRVSPAAINAKQWEWMKRYRVWEANRKVYLFPENWLEPELRDDQSPFFKETMSELLQGDITEDRAATALLNYLAKLEEVAKLEPCGIHHDEKKNIDHVVARTAGANRKYFYRRCEGGSWTPWEQIKLDIEDNPVIPVVWKDRLFLFWLRILKKGPDTAQTPPKGKDLTQLKTDDIPSDVSITVQAVLCWSEYYNGKWQATKTSDINRPTKLGTFGAEFDRSKLRLSVLEEEDVLVVNIYGQGQDQQPPDSFFFYNTHSLPLLNKNHPSPSMLDIIFSKCRYVCSDNHVFSIYYYSGSIMTMAPPLKRTILQSTLYEEIIEPQHLLQDKWNAPFLYTDSQHVFYVTTEWNQVWIGDDKPWWRNIPFNPVPVATIPSLVLQPMPKIPPKPLEEMVPIGINPVFDPASMQRFITEDAYIHKGIATATVVKYGDSQIGITGAVTNNVKK